MPELGIISDSDVVDQTYHGHFTPSFRSSLRSHFMATFSTLHLTTWIDGAAFGTGLRQALSICRGRLRLPFCQPPHPCFRAPCRSLFWHPSAFRASSKVNPAGTHPAFQEGGAMSLGLDCSVERKQRERLPDKKRGSVKIPSPRIEHGSSG